MFRMHILPILFASVVILLNPMVHTKSSLIYKVLQIWSSFANLSIIKSWKVPLVSFSPLQMKVQETLLSGFCYPLLQFFWVLISIYGQRRHQHPASTCYRNIWILSDKLRLKHHIWSLSINSIGIWKGCTGSSSHHMLILTHVRIKVLLKLVKVWLSSLRSTIVISESSCPTILLLHWRIIISILTVMLLLCSPWMSISCLLLRGYLLSGYRVVLHQILDKLLLLFLLFPNHLAPSSIVFILSSDLYVMILLEFLSFCNHKIILLEHIDNLVLLWSPRNFSRCWYNYHSFTVFIFNRAHKCSFFFIRYIREGKRWGRWYHGFFCVI